MSRNYQLGSRDMKDAARMGMFKLVDEIKASFSTARTVSDKFNRFVPFLKDKGIGRMERITHNLVIEFGLSLSDMVDAEELTAGYAQNIVSSINSVLNMATHGEWGLVSPTKDCNIPNRSSIRKRPTATREMALAAIAAMKEQGLERAAAVAELALNFGLRSKEGSLLPKHSLIEDAYYKNLMKVSLGTKGGKTRTIPVFHEYQVDTALYVSKASHRSQSAIPKDQNWKQWREGDLRKGRKVLQQHEITGYHELRATYAAERYLKITNMPAPVNGGVITHKPLDKKARKQIAKELGHTRIDVIGAYIGGRKK